MSFGNTWTFLSWRYTLFVLTWQYPVAFWNRTSHYMVMQPAPVSNPFGTLPAMPQMSIGNGGSCSSVQYGILSLPVSFSPLHFLIVFIEQVGDSKMVVVHWECLVQRVLWVIAWLQHFDGLQVAEKPLPSRTLSVAVPRHLLQRRFKLLPRKYNPISDGKVMFFYMIDSWTCECH